MSRTGRAVVYPAPNAPFEVREYPVRDAREGEVLVRISMSTICRSDIHSYEGRRPNPCPGILGHEIIGVIEQIGDGVREDLRGDPLAAGDRITWTEYFADGPSYYRDVHDMPQKAPGLRKYGHDHVDDDPHFLGGFADYCYILPGTGILKLPDALTDEEATPLNCGVATMISVTEAAAIAVGETVVVQGLGLLGIYGCAIAKARGAARVIGLDAVPGATAGRRTVRGRSHLRRGRDERGRAGRGGARRIASGRAGRGAGSVRSVLGGAGRRAHAAHRRALRARRGDQSGLVLHPGRTRSDPHRFPFAEWITLKGIHNYHPRHLVQALDFVMANRGPISVRRDRGLALRSRPARRGVREGRQPSRAARRHRALTGSRTANVRTGRHPGERP